MEASTVFMVDSNYMDLDVILAASSTIPMKLNENTPPGLFPLIGQTAPTTIGPRGIRVEVPIWLAQSIRDGHYGTGVYPQGYNQNYQLVLQANAQTTSLDDLHHYYYTYGESLCHVLPLDLASPLSSSLLSTWLSRCGMFYARSLQGQTRIEGATREELAVFAMGCKTREDVEKWLRDDRRRTSNKRKLAPYNR